MKVFFLFLISIIVVGCTDNIDPTAHFEPTSTGEESVLFTRAEEDSIVQALATSPILENLTAYNDSLSTISIEPYGFWQGFKKFLKVAAADMTGFCTGFAAALVVLPVLEVDIAAGAVTGAAASITKYDDLNKNSSKKLPTNQSNRFMVVDEYSVMALNDPLYSSNKNLMLRSIGSLTEFDGLLQYFSPALNHNLTLNKYYSNDDFSDLSGDTTLIDSSAKTVLYNPHFLDLMEATNDYLNQSEDDTVDWYYIFSDKDKQMINISQAKAAATMTKFMDAVNMSNSIEMLKHIVSRYMKSVNISSEFANAEKTVLLNSMPIIMYSTVYWSGKN